ncbi:MAG TPA: hypothetical protein VL991_07905 [Terracidiphilus sp.]|nr:hypothetical protein [Terracidiphilus sp.]
MAAFRSTCRDFGPNALALIGLAVAITLWGYGYRLSTYNLHPSSTASAAGAKMCVEPRNSSLVAAARPTATLCFLTALPTLPVARREFPRVDLGLAYLPPQPAPRPVGFGSRLPLRSPPHRFSLA